MNLENDVIVAISTPMGRGAIGMVRLSGEGALEVLKRIFLPNKKQWKSRYMYYGTIVNAGISIDEVMCCYMRAPKTYTREDIVEIYAHGGISTIRGVLDAALQNGARLAHPGEFTKRAFLNGRINLSQAEAVMDIINAGTDAARRAGLRQLGGGLSKRIESFRDIILKWLAHIELSIDYPEHESEAMNRETIIKEGANLLVDIKALYKTSEMGRIFREGIKTVIIGRPNVGKSTLLNAILREDRAIVTEIPGTTRDVLIEPVQIKGIPLLLADTAGIRETNDPIEKIGVEKSLAQVQDSELILYVMDRSNPPTEEDKELLSKLQNKPVIVLLNKCDLPPGLGWDDYLSDFEVISLSAKEIRGLDDLYATISTMFLEGIESDDVDIITRERHQLLLQKAIGHLSTAINNLEGYVPEDLVSIDLREAYYALGEVLGHEIGDDILERIFSEFCVGK